MQNIVNKEIHQQVIARKKELEQIRMENRIENNKREERKMMLKKLTVIEKGKTNC